MERDRAGRPARGQPPHAAPRHRPAARASGTRSTPSGESTAGTSSSPARRCHRCCSTTRRRWRSRSACARPRSVRWTASRRSRSRPWPSSSGCCRPGCAAGSAPSAPTPCPWPARAHRRPAVLTVIAQACRDQERLRFGYAARDGNEAERRVEPYRLVAAGRRWYLLAWDLDRDDWRTFRVDRGHNGVTSTGWRFEAEDPARRRRGRLRRPGVVQLLQPATKRWSPCTSGPTTSPTGSGTWTGPSRRWTSTRACSGPRATGWSGWPRASRFWESTSRSASRRSSSTTSAGSSARLSAAVPA